MLSAGGRGAVLAADAAPNPWFDPSYVTDNWDTILRLPRRARQAHASPRWCSARVIALPLALLARRSRFLAGPVLGLSTLIYTIPSLAMFAFVAPFTGLSSTTVLIGLVLYSLVILVRNFLAGLQAVPARRAGGGPRDGLRAGAAVPGRSSCPWRCRRSWPACGSRRCPPSPLTTVGVIVGHGGLGQLIIGGFNANFYRAEIVTGALGCVLLALVADLLLAGVERAADAVGPDGPGVNGFSDALVYLNDPFNWTRTDGGILDLLREHLRSRSSPCCSPRWSRCRSAIALGHSGAGAGSSSRCPTSAGRSRRWRC